MTKVNPTYNFATPSRRLKTLWLRWIDLHAALKTEVDGQRPAAPFFSAAPLRKGDRCILLVGKATARDWWLESYRQALRKSPNYAICERLARNRRQVEGKRTSFWNLFHRLTDLDTSLGTDRVIWTNVAKIGSKEGNPSGLLLSLQAELAEQTLREEMSSYDPALTIFATGGDSDLSRIITRALGVSDRSWARSRKSDVWWQEGRRALLWTRHPQGATNIEIKGWIKRARQLIGS